MARNLFDTKKDDDAAKNSGGGSSEQSGQQGGGSEGNEGSGQTMPTRLQTQPNGEALNESRGMQIPSPVSRIDASQLKVTPRVDNQWKYEDNSTSGINRLGSMFTTPAQEERLRKTSVARQRILAVGDALRHIGNIYNTVHYAPSQQFNSPVNEERDRYEKGKALRDAANVRYMSYRQAKEAQDAQQRRWEANFQYNAMKDAANMGETKRKNDAYIARQETLSRLDDAREKGLITDNQYKQLRNEWYPKVQEATIEQKKASTAASRVRAANDTKRTTAYVNRQQSGGGKKGAPILTPNGLLYPPTASHDRDQYLQLYGIAEKNGWTNEGEVQRRLRATGFGKDTSETVKRQIVNDLLRDNAEFATYAEKLGWSYNGSGTSNDDYDLGLEDDDDMDLDLE